MASELTSMLKTLLEAQQREMAWDPTSHHGFESSSTYQEGLPNGYSTLEYQYGDEYPTLEYQYGYNGYSTQGYRNEYGGSQPQEYQYGYGDGYEPWNMQQQPDWNYAQGYQCPNVEYGNEELSPSPFSRDGEIYNLLELLLEEQEKCNESLRVSNEIDAMTQCSRVVDATYVESINTELSQWIEEEEEECILHRKTNIEEVIPNDIGEVLEKDAQIKDKFLHEAEECIKELELLLGCTVDENLLIRYEEQFEPVATMSYSTKINGEEVGMDRKTFEDPCESTLVVEYIVDMNEVDKHLGILSTTPLIYHGPRKTPFEKIKMKKLRGWLNDAPRKTPFEEIRMNEFKGWFYDEYDPGDPSSTFPPT